MKITKIIIITLLLSIFSFASESTISYPVPFANDVNSVIPSILSFILTSGTFLFWDLIVLNFIFFNQIINPILIYLIVASILSFFMARKYYKEIEEHEKIFKKTNEELHEKLQWRYAYSFFSFLFSLLVIFLWLVFGNQHSKYFLSTTTYAKYQEIVNDTTTTRTSCSQIVNTYNTTTYEVNKEIFVQFSFTGKDTTSKVISRYPIKTTTTQTETLVDILKIDNVACGDTVTTIDKAPYNDKPFSVVKTKKMFIDSNFKLTKDITYKNKSPNISESEYNDVFRGRLAEWKQDRFTTKYSLKMMDENNSDTLNTEEEAIELKNSKCKDKATIAGKLIYSEYDACKNNNIIQPVTIVDNIVCGHSKIKIDYNRGTISERPSDCRYDATWQPGATWQTEEEGIIITRRTGRKARISDF